MPKPLAYLLIFTGVLLLLGFLSPRDSTDPADGRSGLVIKVDAATGCNYLSVWRGGLTPRLRADGTPWCDPSGAK